MPLPHSHHSQLLAKFILDYPSSVGIASSEDTCSRGLSHVNLTLAPGLDFNLQQPSQ